MGLVGNLEAGVEGKPSGAKASLGGLSIMTVLKGLLVPIFV